MDNIKVAINNIKIIVMKFDGIERYCDNIGK